MARSGRLQGALVLLAAGAIFSFGPVIFRAVAEATDWQFLACRAGSAGLVASGWLVLHNGRTTWSVLQKTELRTWLAGVLLGGAMVCFILALARIEAAPVVLMLSATPMVAAGVGRMVLAERVRPAAWVAMGFGAGGAAIMIGGNLRGLNATGLLLAGAIPVVMGVYSVLIRSAGPGGDPLVPVVIGGVLAGSVSAAMSLIGPGLGLPIRDALLGFVGGGVLMGLGLPLFNYGHRFAPAAEVPLLGLSEVVLAPLWVWIWPGETPAAATLVGGSILLGSVAGLALTAKRVDPALSPT